MPQVLLGIVERFSHGKSGPGARLRPVFQASTDKSHWIEPEGEFPNSGVVSWWQPSPDAHLYRAWTFHIEESWTYDAAAGHHDFYGVKGIAAPAVELIDIPTAHDPEDVRSLLLEEGIPLDRCASKKVVFRDGSGSMVGPLDLTIRDARLFMEEKDSYASLNHGSSDLSLAEWEGHLFLPLENGIRKIGEVDFSPNSVFVGRVLREIREMPLAEMETAKMTVKMIRAYTSALEKTSLNPSQAQRLKRLHKLAGHAGDAIALADDALPDLLSLAPVKELIAAASDRAVKKAIEEHHGVLAELDTRRMELVEKIGSLEAEDQKLRAAIMVSQNEQSELLASFEGRIQEKFEEIGKSATSFLSGVALIRAALFPAAQAPSLRRSDKKTFLPKSEPIHASDLAAGFRRRFEAGGLGRALPATLLSSWIAGFAPMLFGASARDALLAAANTLFGGSVHFVTVGPTCSSPAELTSLPTTSLFDVSTVGDVVAESSRSEDLTLLVFADANLSQIDSALLPILRSYTAAHAKLEGSASLYPTPAGMWPSNLLVAGVLIDSPLALPLSTELWTCATFVDTGKSECPKPVGAEQEPALPLQRLSFQEWITWGETLEKAPTASDTGILATHLLRQVEGSPLFRRMVRRLAAAIDLSGSPLKENEKTAALARVTVVPYLLSHGLHPDVVLNDTAVDIAADSLFVDRATALFEKWGIKAARE